MKKTPAAGALLGILPGFGSFYGRAYGVGVVNLIFWPLSICWDPVSGYRASDRINYAATKQHVATLRNKELNDLNTKRASGLVDDNFYKMGLYDISQKYDIEPMAMPIISGPISNTGTNNNSTSNKDQRIQALQQQNLPYGEYQRRYNEIMAE